MTSAIERVDAVHPDVARALRGRSGMERLRLAHETWEMVRDRLGAYLNEFYVDEEAAHDAIRTSGQFNIVHPTSGLKIDVYVNPDTPYDRARLARRQSLPLLPGVRAYFARPEDVILYKLLYHRQAASGPHLRDILGILRVSGHELDQRYVAQWADRLGLGPLWEQVRKQAE